MTSAGSPTERFVALASGAGQRARHGEGKSSGSADAGAVGAFPELLSRLAEAGTGRSTIGMQSGTPDGAMEAIAAIELDGGRVPQADTGDPAGGAALLQPMVPVDSSSAASMLAALLAGATALPSRTPQPMTPAGGVADIARQLAALADPDAAPLPEQTDAASGLPPPGVDAAQGSRLGMDVEPAGPMPKVIVVRQETHLAPMPATPVANLPDGASAAAGPSPIPAERRAEVPHATPTAAGQTPMPVPQAAERLVAPSAATGRDGKAAPSAGNGQMARPDDAAAADATDSAPQPNLSLSLLQRGRDQGSASAHHSSGGGAETSAGAHDDAAVANQSLADATEGIAALRKELDYTLPQSASSPATQIADRIAREGAALADSMRSADSAPVRPAASGAVKMLHIELQPVDLGTVTVRMTLKDGVLELQLDAGREETARLLQQDRDTLSSILRSAGYHVDAMTVRVAEPDRSAPAPAASPAFSGQPESQRGSAQADGRSPGGHDRAGHQNPDTHPTPRSRHDQEGSAAHRLGRDLYV